MSFSRSLLSEKKIEIKLNIRSKVFVQIIQRFKEFNDQELAIMLLENRANFGGLGFSALLGKFAPLIAHFGFEQFKTSLDEFFIESADHFPANCQLIMVRYSFLAH